VNIQGGLISIETTEMRSILKSTDAFEVWMRERTDVSERLLAKKHRKMADGPFPFLRATFYRWVEQWPAECPALAGRDQDILSSVASFFRQNALGSSCVSRVSFVSGAFRSAGIRIGSPFARPIR